MQAPPCSPSNPALLPMHFQCGARSSALLGKHCCMGGAQQLPLWLLGAAPLYENIPHKQAAGSGCMGTQEEERKEMRSHLLLLVQ